MKKLLLILTIILISLLSYAQLPTSCGGSTEMYGVIGNNGLSNFYWEIEGGEIITNYNDSILVKWDDINNVGILKVIEVNSFGCEGDQITDNVIISIPLVDIGIDYEICENETYEFETTYDDLYTYQWQDGSTNNNLITNQTGQYWVSVTDNNSCFLSDTANLLVNPLPLVDLGNDTLICHEDEITLDVSEYGISYEWFNGDISFFITLYSETIRQTISVIVMDEKGCFGSDTIIIESCGEFIIPNTFTPNEDGYNETWVIEGLYNYPNVTVSVYSRWGDIVFSSKGYSSDKYWDGRDNKGNKLPMDAYYYVIDLHNNKYPLVGTVTIIR